jgi:hypothetical protein
MAAAAPVQELRGHQARAGGPRRPNSFPDLEMGVSLFRASPTRLPDEPGATFFPSG